MPRPLHAALAALAIAIAAPAAAQQTDRMGGAPMLPSRSILENAVQSKDHSSLVTALRAADLAEGLDSGGPFTLFAPTDAGFDNLPEGLVDGLLEPENQERLARVLNCHVVEAEVMSQALADMIESDGGSHEIETRGPCVLTAEMSDGSITLSDPNDREAVIRLTDISSENGVIHTLNQVMLPK